MGEKSGVLVAELLWNCLITDDFSSARDCMAGVDTHLPYGSALASNTQMVIL